MWTEAPTGGVCWWNMASTACAVCKPGGMQCGYPLQDKCHKQHPTRGCPGIKGSELTLSQTGYPCYWDHSNSSCAWCSTSNPASPGYQLPTPGGNCVAAKFQEKFDAVKGDCEHIPKCDDNASCQQSDTGAKQCKCNFGYTGSGIQCADANGVLEPPAGVVLASLEITLSNEFYVFVPGEEPIPLTG